MVNTETQNRLALPTVLGQGWHVPTVAEGGGVFVLRGLDVGEDCGTCLCQFG